MTAGRPIGNHIRTICEILERIGPSHAYTLLDHYAAIEYSNMSKYCSRAVGLGLMTVIRGTGKPSNRNVYTVVSNWRELIELRATTKLKPVIKPRQSKQTKWQGVNSVFSMGEA
jgi:hypothetical protein